MFPFKHVTKKQLLRTIPFICIIPFLILIGVLLFGNNTEKKFLSLTDSMFKAELQDSTLNLHYTLANPQDYGIKPYAAVLPCYSKDQTQLSWQEHLSFQKDFSKINPEKLSSESQILYQLLYRYFDLADSQNPFTYYQNPLSPAQGMQSELPILLAEYAFRNKQDVEDYLSLLDQTDEYFASLSLYMEERKQAGIVTSDTTLQKVKEQCDTILTKGELQNGTHFLQTTFKERLEPLLSQKIINEEESDYYLNLNDRYLQTVMQPAYEQLADHLFLLMEDDASTPSGLSSLPGGKSYYEWIVRKNTGSDRSINEMKEILYPHFDVTYKELSSLLLSRDDSVALWENIMENDPVLPKAPTEIISDLQIRMSRDFPSFVNDIEPVLNEFTSPLPLSKENVELTIKTVSDSLSAYCAPAFYLTPPLDDYKENVIYINETSTPSGLSLYTTLAHEGYPGHLYQSVYSRLIMEQNSQPLRGILWYGGFQEGWAIYVEFLSFDYAALYANEHGNPDAAYAYQIEKTNRDAQLCLYALLDIAIHYDNAPLEKVAKVLSTMGIHDEASVAHVYNYIAEEPANYLKYYMGYMEICNIKEQAKSIWGSSYSDLRFHTFLLSNGPCDFQTLLQLLKESIPPVS